MNKNIEKPKLRILNGIIKVKNASVVYDNETETYHLVHYDTEILRVKKDNTIIFALKCSNSSTRAIYQLTDFLKIDREDVHLKPYDKFLKYNMSNDIKLKNNDYLDIFTE